MATVYPRLSTVMPRMTVLMEVTRPFVHQNAMETTGFAAITATASQTSGCVTRRMTAWTGAMRPTARRRKPLLINLILPHVLALTTGVEMVSASLSAGLVTSKTIVMLVMMRIPSCVERRRNVMSLLAALELAFHTGGCVTVGWTAQMDLMKEITVARRGMEQTRVTWTKAGTLARMDQDASNRNMFATPPLNVEMEVTRAHYALRSLTAPPRHVHTGA